MTLKPKPNLWTRWTGWLTNLERHELTWLVVGLGGCLLLMIFLMLAGEVMEGDTLAFDTKIVRAFRQANDPSLPIGPAWTVTVLEDLTAMGGPTILTLVVLSIIGFLVLQTRYRTALVIFITSASGEIVNYSMKAVFMRARPTIVPHLREAFSTSFPSGHAMESAIIYLTLGAMLMRIAERRITKMYCFGMALLLTFLVGLSRVYLGVHYPTDVLGGWIIGLFWASICWLAAQHFEARAGIKAERQKTA